MERGSGVSGIERGSGRAGGVVGGVADGGCAGKNEGSANGLVGGGADGGAYCSGGGGLWKWCLEGSSLIFWCLSPGVDSSRRFLRLRRRKMMVPMQRAMKRMRDIRPPGGSAEWRSSRCESGGAAELAGVR